MDAIESFLKRDNTSKLSIVVVIFLVYFVFINNGLSVHTFMILLFVFVLFSYHRNNTKVQRNLNNSLEVYIQELENKVVHHRTPEMMLEHVYTIHKPLKDLYHIKKNNVFKEVLFRLQFLQIYEQQQYFDIVVMMEYFLKIHFNTMIGKYDYQTNYNIMEDIREEIINAMYSCYFNIPRYSKTFVSPNLEDALKKSIRMFQSITYKLLKIVRNKYTIMNEPKTHDVNKNERYHMM